MLMLGAVDIMGVYKSVSDVMGLHGGCSPVVPLTLVAHSWDLEEFRSGVITDHNKFELDFFIPHQPASIMMTTMAAGEPIPHHASPSLTLATSIDCQK